MSAEDTFTLLRCPRCGWVHYALTPADILPGADLEPMRRCFRCQAPASELQVCREVDGPKSVTIQGVLWEGWT